MAGYLNNRCIGPYTFTNPCNSEIFNKWLEEQLVPELSPGQVVIMDNAKFHKHKRTRQLIEGAKCELLYLPAYSPDLNPIEHYWAKLKRWLKENRERFGQMLDALNHYFLVAT